MQVELDGLSFTVRGFDAQRAIHDLAGNAWGLAWVLVFTSVATVMLSAYLSVLLPAALLLITIVFDAGPRAPWFQRLTAPLRAPWQARVRGDAAEPLPTPSLRYRRLSIAACGLLLLVIHLEGAEDTALPAMALVGTVVAQQLPALRSRLPDKPTRTGVRVGAQTVELRSYAGPLRTGRALLPLTETSPVVVAGGGVQLDGEHTLWMTQHDDWERAWLVDLLTELRDRQQESGVAAPQKRAALEALLRR